MIERNPMLFVFPMITSGGRRQPFADYYYTRDGLSLTHSTFPASREWMSPVFGKGKYVTASSNGSAMEIYISPNAKTWTKTATMGPADTLGKLVFSGEAFYFFAQSNSVVYKSTDTVTWTAVGTVPTIHTSIYYNSCGIAYYDGTFVVGSYNTQTSKIDLYYSNNDCSTWTAASINYTGPSQMRTSVRGIVAVEDGFALCVSGSASGGSGATYTSKFFYSSNGASWSESTFSKTGDYSAWGFVGNNSTAAFVDTVSTGYKSNDGNSWTTFPLSVSVMNNAGVTMNRRYFCVGAFNNGVFSVCSSNLQDGTVETSSTSMVSPTTSSYTYYYRFSAGAF